MDPGQWNQQYSDHGMEHYGDGHISQRHGSLASQTYGHQREQYGLLGPPDVAIPNQPTTIDVDEISRLTSTTNDPPYAPRQRPQSGLQVLHSRSFLSASGPATESCRHVYHQPELGGSSSTTASDSAYQSRNQTCAPAGHSFGGQVQHGSYVPFPNAPHQADFDYASNAGTESVLSGSKERDGNHRGKQKRPRARSLVPPCSWCRKQLKNPSDAQKHQLQHFKPFRCTELGCVRPEGFATQNDLQRHRGSVHGRTPLVGRQNGYICIACPLPQGSGIPKFWPRKDNFKAHVRRKHSQLDLEQVVQLSAKERPDDAIDAMTAESGYGSGSHIDPLDQTYQQELPSPIVPGPPGHMPQQGDHLFGLGSATQNDALAGVGVGAGPLADSAVSREPDFGLYAADSQCGLSVLSNVAAAVNNMSSPARSCTPAPVRPHGSIPQLMVSQHGPGIKLQSDLDAMQWSPDGYERPRQNDGGGATEYPTSRDGDGNFECHTCHKRKKRECDLRKHMKRHKRPYGCSFPHCFKRFGSRNDWKRHESSQHCLQDMWRCVLPAPFGSICGKFTHDAGSFADHLQKRHHDSIGNTQIGQYCEFMHLGANANIGYWCGFCDKIIRQNEEELQNALEARYKHIGDHYDKDDRHVNDWICVEANKPKGQLSAKDKSKAKARARSGRADDDSDLGEDGIPLPPLHSGYPRLPSCSMPAYDPGMVAQSTSYTYNTKRRRVSPDIDADADNVSDDDGWRAS